MSALVLTSAKTTIGTAWTGTAPGPGNPTVSGTIDSGTDWSDWIKQVTLDMSVAMEDFTTFGDGAFVTNLPGLKSGTIQLEFNQDFASSQVDATIGAAFLAGTLLYLDIMPTSSSRGTGNPSYVYAAYVSKYTPLGQAVGARAAVTPELTVTGTYARLTS